MLDHGAELCIAGRHVVVGRRDRPDLIVGRIPEVRLIVKHERDVRAGVGGRGPVDELGLVHAAVRQVGNQRERARLVGVVLEEACLEVVGSRANVAVGVLVGGNVVANGQRHDGGYGSGRRVREQPSDGLPGDGGAREEVIVLEVVVVTRIGCVGLPVVGAVAVAAVANRTQVVAVHASAVGEVDAVDVRRNGVNRRIIADVHGDIGGASIARLDRRNERGRRNDAPGLARTLPLEHGLAVAARVLEVLHPELVALSRDERDFGRVLPAILAIGAVLSPVVHEQLPIHPQANAVVGLRIEGVRLGEVGRNAPRPACRECVGLNPCGRSAVAPMEV